MECVRLFPGGSKNMFSQYLTQLLHSTTIKSHLPPIQRGQHHVFSAEHTTRDILSFMAQVQGLNLPSEFLADLWVSKSFFPKVNVWTHVATRDACEMIHPLNV